jgi:hypothetical protein
MLGFMKPGHIQLAFGGGGGGGGGGGDEYQGPTLDSGPGYTQDTSDWATDERGFVVSTGGDGGSSNAPRTSPVPTPRPQTVTVPTGSGPRDVFFNEYAEISRNPTGINARSIDYIQPGPLPSVSPEVESAINDYMNREPTFMDKALDALAYVSPLAGVANMMSDFTRNTIQDQLTTPVNTYTGTRGPGILGGLGQAITAPGQNVDRYAPVTNQRGQIIGSMALDANGNPVGYTGTPTSQAVFNDSGMSPAQMQAAAGMVNPPDVGGSGDNETNMDGQAINAAMQTFAQEPDCPEGYMYDTTSQSCVPRPEMSPFPEVQTFTPAPLPMPQYTGVGSLQAPTLTPGVAPGFNVAPTTVPPIGIASINPFTS